MIIILNLKQRKIIIEIFVVLLVPHIVWLFNNDFITINYGFKRAGLTEAVFFDHLVA